MDNLACAEKGNKRAKLFWGGGGEIKPLRRNRYK